MPQRWILFGTEYLRGDLERLDVQKSFMKALLSKVKEKSELFSLFKFVSKSSDVLLDINKSSSLCFLLKNGLKISDGELLAETLPGRALKHEGVWYYIIKREEAALLIEKLFKYSEFDKQNNFIYNL